MIHEETPFDAHLDGPYPNLYATLGLKLHIAPPLSWRYRCIHGEIFLYPRGKIIDLFWTCCLILLLLPVLLPLRTLSIVVAKLATPKALDIEQILFLILLSLQALSLAIDFYLPF